MKTIAHSRKGFLIRVFFILPLLSVLSPGCGTGSFPSVERVLDSEPIIDDGPESVPVTASVETFTSDCVEESDLPVSFDQGEEVVTDADQARLDCQLNYAPEPVAIVPESVAAGLASPSALSVDSGSTRVGLTLLATVRPPRIKNGSLAATDVVFLDDRAIVTYNTAGDSYQGGVQVVDVADPRRPRLVFQSVFKYRDVNTGFLSGRTLYLAEAESVERTGNASPAQLQPIVLNAEPAPITLGEPVPLPSYAGTGAIVVGESVFVTTGATGGLVRLDASDLSQTGYVALADARSVDSNPDDGLLYVFQGTPGRVSAVNPVTLETNTFPVGGATIPGSKGTLMVSDNRLFVGDGDGGVKILSTSGDMLGEIPNPVISGLDPSLTVTNAVTVQGDLLFISNGEAGIRAALWNDGTDSVTATVLGQLQLGSRLSANGIAYSGNLLMVADGLGGLKIISVNRSPYLGDVDCDLVAAVFCEDFSVPDGTRVNDNVVWAGKHGEVADAVAVGRGASVKKKVYVDTVESFATEQAAKHFSAKMLKSGNFKVVTYDDVNYGTFVMYDGKRKVIAYVGQLNSTSSRQTISFALPSLQAFIVAHVYQQGRKVQVTLELADGSLLSVPAVTSSEPRLSNDMMIRLTPYGPDETKTSAQPQNSPSFDNVLVEEHSF